MDATAATVSDGFSSVNQTDPPVIYPITLMSQAMFLLSDLHF